MRSRPSACTRFQAFYCLFLPVEASPAPAKGTFLLPPTQRPEAASAPQDTLQPKPPGIRILA